MRRSYAFILLTALVLSAPVFAEIYQYRDETGALTFTDDFSRVPEDKRSDVKKYSEYKSALPSDEEGSREVEATETFSTETVAENAGDNSHRSQFESLQTKKEDLDQRYKELAAEKDALRNMRDEDDSEAGKRAYNAKVSELNQRISAFERDLEVYSRDVGALNQRLTE